jgi:hypothetical protein
VGSSFKYAGPDITGEIAMEFIDWDARWTPQKVYTSHLQVFESRITYPVDESLYQLSYLGSYRPLSCERKIEANK